MNHRFKKPFVARALSAHEREVAEWLLGHADISESERVEFLSQLGKATVVRECECGCASIDFAIEGLPSPRGGLGIIGDFVCGDNQDGIFIFEKEGILAGIEIYQMASEKPCAGFPPTSQIHDY